MTRFSSGPTRDQIRAINAQMVEKTLGQDAQPLVEGGLAVQVLESRGRVSGQIRQTPIGVITVVGVAYLISPDPTRDWVVNLDVTSDCALRTADGSRPQHAVRVGGAEAVTAISTYLAVLQVQFALRAFPVQPGAEPAEIEAKLDGMAVFRLESRESI